MRLVDREDLELIFPILLSLAAGRLRMPPARRLLAETLASLAYHFSAKKRRMINRALDRAFAGSLSAGQRKAITMGSLRGVWEELSHVVSGPIARRDFEPCEIRGLDCLRETLARGRGVILWESSGLGPRMMPKRLLEEQGFPIHQVHAFNHIGGLQISDPAGSHLRARQIAPFFRKCEAYFVSGGQTYLPREGSLASLRNLERWLAQNDIIAVAGDGHLGHQTLAMPFLGTEKEFATGMVSLAKRSGAGLLPTFCVRQDHGGHVLDIQPPIPLPESVDRKRLVHDILSAYTRLLEDYIRQYPSQYRNWHHIS